MRILIACDSFKDALPAAAVCKAIAIGLQQRYASAHITEFPLADGGDGMLEVLAAHLSLDVIQVPTVDPLFRPIQAPIGISRDGKLAVIEMAKASGIQLLKAHERDVLRTTTLGTGQLIAAAIERQVKRIVLGIGGSATHDVGMGAAHALGWRFLSRSGAELAPIGCELTNVENIIRPPHRMSTHVDVLCDVDSPLCGPRGAAHMYARQKGASEETVALLDRSSAHFAELVRMQVAPVDPNTAGCGAAGGLGFGAIAFRNAPLQRGVSTMLDLTGFDAALANCDVVITGEGKLDAQTLQGKLIAGVCERARLAKVPVIALAGQIAANAEQLKELGLTSAHCINTNPDTTAAMLANSAVNLTMTAATLQLP